MSERAEGLSEELVEAGNQTCGEDRGGSRDRSLAPQLLRLVWTVMFAVAMAFTEACVVVYIRGIFDALKSPVNLDLRVVGWFATKHPWVLVTEEYREASTIIMLVSLAYLAGRNARERWGVFILSFGIWDIFYYVWLYALIRWPPSLLTRDVLFLIPVPWVAPVLAPLLVALEMVLVGGFLFMTARVKTVVSNCSTDEDPPR